MLALGAQAVPLITDDGSNWVAEDVLPPGTPHTTNITQTINVGGSGLPGITFASITNPVPYEDNVYTTTGVADYNYGNYAGIVDSVTFTFYSAGAYAPDELSLYFEAGGHTYYYDLSAPAQNGTTPYTVSTTSGAGWYSDNGGSSAVFLGDITSVTAVGIRLVYDTAVSGQQDYGIGGYTLNQEPRPVPEPETVWLMMAVALSMAFTFRSRMGDVIKKLKGAVVRA